MPVSALTFKMLKNEMSRLAALANTSEQGLSNHNSALNGFMAQFGLNDNDTVGSTLRVSVYRYVAQHVEKLHGQGQKSAHVANIRSSLKKWRSVVAQMDRAGASEAGALSPLQEMLKDLVTRRFSQQRIATDAGVPLSSLKRWLKGNRPNGRGLVYLGRLELFFGLPPGALVELVSPTASASRKATTGVAEPIAYRERQRVASADPYRLKEVNDVLRGQWRDFVAYKSSPKPLLKRDQSGRWSVTRDFVDKETERNWYAFSNHCYLATAAITWGHISMFLGWLLRPDASGVGAPSVGPDASIQDINSLAWLARSDLVEGYINWRIARSGNTVHRGIQTFLALVTSLTHPKTGYLRQRPDLMETLPIRHRPSNWEDMCLATYTSVKELRRTLEYELDESRDSREPIKATLALANPMEAIADMAHRMRADRPLTGGNQEAIWFRDMFLVKLLACNPLRAKNLKLMRYREDNTGNLYRKPDGSWHIRFHRRDFKNASGAARDRDYDMPVNQHVFADIEKYLRVYRPMLAGLENPFVFVSGRPDEPNVAWNSLNRRIFAITSRYLWKCPGVGPHGFRHIVATSILKASPGDWQTAALVLHDREETVRKHYAHLVNSDGATRMAALLSGAFKRM